MDYGRGPRFAMNIQEFMQLQQELLKIEQFLRVQADRAIDDTHLASRLDIGADYIERAVFRCQDRIESLQRQQNEALSRIDK